MCLVNFLWCGLPMDNMSVERLGVQIPKISVLHAPHKQLGCNEYADHTLPVGKMKQCSHEYFVEVLDFGSFPLILGKFPYICMLL